MKKLHFLRCSWTASSSVEQHKPSSSRRVPNVTIAFQLKSWREFYLLRPASPTFSTLVGKACCKLSNFIGPFAYLRWLRVLEKGNCVATSPTSTTNPRAERHQQHLSLHMERHLRSVDIKIEMTSRHMGCTHFILDHNQMPAVAPRYHGMHFV